MRVGDFKKVIHSGATLEQIIALIPDVMCGVKTFYANFPSLIQYYPKDKNSSVQWALAIPRHKTLMHHCDFSLFNSEAWMQLLRVQPQYISYCNQFSVITKQHWLVLIKHQPSILNNVHAKAAAEATGVDVSSYKIPKMSFTAIDPEAHNYVAPQLSPERTKIKIKRSIFKRGSDVTVNIK